MHDVTGALSETGLAASVVREIGRHMAAPIAPGLHIVATPIGALGDITLRALSTLARVDLVCCEDTRRSAPLLKHFGIDRPLRPYHEHNAEAERPRLLADLANGRRIALISDAGTPLISDPGYKLVRAALDAGHRVMAVPGPSAVTAALSCAGLPTACFLFAGFLPARQAARRTRIAELQTLDATLVLFETGPRLAEAIGDLRDVLGARAVVIARELTKFHEEVVRGDLQTLDAAALTTLGEHVILVAPPAARDVSDAEIAHALATLGPSATVRDAARHVADTLGVARSRVYTLALKTRT
jgi:16S rRNA (cytidine1402-2'-O)-methyltransferase